MTGEWREYPHIELPSPVLALLADAGALWAGGLGGVTHYVAGQGWTPAAAGLPLRSVTALAAVPGTLLAGGEGGLARSLDDGRTWQRCSVPGGTGTVTGLALSPRFPEDGTALAATLDNGILRSTDSGRTWQTSSFGLASPEVLAVAWGTGETAIAATASGLVRSPNGGRAWRGVAGTGDTAFAALAAGEDGELLAAPETGAPLRSSHQGSAWAPLGGLLADVQISVILHLGDRRILLGTTHHGLLRSTDAGATWSRVAADGALTLAAGERRVYAGGSDGVRQSEDDGETWSDLPPPPLHDLHRLLIVAGLPLIFGSHTPPVIASADGCWTTLSAVVLPLTALAASPAGVLFASTPHGLYRSDDRGTTWDTLAPGPAGCVTQITFDATGRGWAGITPDGEVLRTRDGGRTWAAFPAPFGVLPLVALQALPGSLLAATYDERQQAVSTWRSADDGETWVRGADAITPWPVVASGGSPPVMTVGSTIAVQQADRSWRQTILGETGLRRVASNGTVLIALAVDGLWRSDDHGATWSRDDLRLPLAEIADIALAGESLFALLAGGRLWSRPL